jgi:hypothetical protein
VKNIGENDSILNWKIASTPSWGTWYFNPEHGEGLKPGDDPVTIQVSVIAPREKHKEFSGFIRVENQDDPEDYDVISVYLKTPMFKQIYEIPSSPIIRLILSILNK